MKNNSNAAKKRRLRKRRRRRFLLVLVLLALAGVLFVAFGGFLSVAVNSFMSNTVGSVTDETQTTDDGYVTDSITESPTERKDLVDSIPVAQVPLFYQYPQLPAGCEATSAAMLLQAYGYGFSKEEVAEAIPSEEVRDYNGEYYGPHPSTAFAGSPFSSDGYGAFPQPVAKGMQTLIDRENGIHYAQCLVGADEGELLSYIDKGMPLCVWVTINLLELVDVGGWYIKDGETYTDENFQWPGNEHCVVLVDYDSDSVTAYDPLTGIERYDRELFFERYNELGKFAIVMKEEE